METLSPALHGEKMCEFMARRVPVILLPAIEILGLLFLGACRGPLPRENPLDPGAPRVALSVTAGAAELLVTWNLGAITSSPIVQRGTLLLTRETVAVACDPSGSAPVPCEPTATLFGPTAASGAAVSTYHDQHSTPGGNRRLSYTLNLIPSGTETAYVLAKADYTDSGDLDGDGATETDCDDLNPSVGTCDQNAACDRTKSAWVCACAAGYLGDGMTCAEGECLRTHGGGCDLNATCANTTGSHTCTCNPGWTGTGIVCSDVDECTTNNGGCDANATCTNTPGSRTCTCNPGWTGTGIVCGDVNECAVSNGSCDSNAMCTNDPGSFHCTCNPGYSGSGLVCSRFSVTSVSMGESEICAAKADGSLWCWSAHGSGETCVGTKTDHPAPIMIVSLANDVVRFSSGEYHACAIRSDGSLWCWGGNDDGALGVGTTSYCTTPAMVTGLDAHVASVSAGSTGACVVKTDSSLWCWGDNSNGELGDGTKTLRAAPVVVTGFSTGGAASVSAGYTYHTCAVKTDGSLWCWGYNWCGQLGDGTKTDRSTPVMVTGFSSGVASVSARGSFTCAVKTDGSLWCWGENYYGQLGDGTITQRLTPVMVTGFSSGVAAVATGGEHTCAVKTDGSLWCWGWNQFGQLGDGTKTDRSTPAVSPGLSAGVASVAAGEASTCAVKTDGSLWCWGSNQDGWLGDGTKTDQSTPQQIPAAPH